MDDDGGFGSVVRLVATALVSAVMTATLVIAVGQTLLDRSVADKAPPRNMLFQASR